MFGLLPYWYACVSWFQSFSFSDVWLQLESKKEVRVKVTILSCVTTYKTGHPINIGVAIIPRISPSSQG